ncbi:MAG: YfjI family protein [Actinomycetota bacterium]|nr:YfjI family protein [Actinomycetota bacterium]MDQ6945493.1 YfjI family protein [Actinomycetota bacterium]
MTAWPAAPDTAVYHGPAGEFVARTEPHTESDPMALLAQFLVAFGAAAGRGAYYQVEASRHYPNEFVVLVGASAKGRKGSSWDHVEALLHHVDDTFVDHCLASGMSSGEGLIAEVKDTDGEPGADDKRKLVLESEFAQVLKVLSREGNTLSPVIRNAWDSKPLRTMVKTAPLRATGAHIAIVGHITKDELLRHINATELANGFFNRFMLVAVQRSKELPFGGRLTGDSLAVVRTAVRDALIFARTPRPVAFGPEARERWSDAYSALSRGEAGMFGASTARAEAHTVRLALIYALLDRSETIDLVHLEAALAFWVYSATSSQWVFGDSLGDPTADEIWALACDRTGGVSRTEVSNLFSRNKKAREIDRALTVLVDARRLERRTIIAERGRPTEVWVPIHRAS